MTDDEVTALAKELGVTEEDILDIHARLEELIEDNP